MCLLVGVLAACQGNAAPPQVGRLLFWDQDAKQVLWLENGQRSAPLAEQVERAALCASTTTQAVYYAGTASEGGFYLLSLTGKAAPIKLATGAPMGCDAVGRTTFSPDGKRLAVLVYPAGAGLGVEYATATLKIVDSTTGQTLKEFPDTLSYTWFQNTLSLVTARSAAGSITSAAVTVWQTDTSTQSELPLPPAAPGCTLVNVQVSQFEQAIYAALGERCANPTGYFATLYQIAPDKPIVLSDRKVAGGKFYPDTNTHTLRALSDGNTLLWIIPDGRSIETGTLWRWFVNRRQGESLALFTVTDQSPMLLGHRYALDPLGEQLAYIQRNPQGGETLWLWELTRPESEPAQINEMIRSDKITALAWSANGTRLGYLFVATESFLSYIDKRGVRRDAVPGAFQSLVLSQTGDYANTVQQSAKGYALLQIRLQDGATTPLSEGAALSPIPLLSQ